jgi:hypothetical protein
MRAMNPVNQQSAPESKRPVYLCPICEREMIQTGFCHLECPGGHYQEVCSDLFPADRVPMRERPQPNTDRDANKKP